jgi:hypothetical protein
MILLLFVVGLFVMGLFVMLLFVMGLFVVCVMERVWCLAGVRIGGGWEMEGGSEVERD